VVLFQTLRPPGAQTTSLVMPLTRPQAAPGRVFPLAGGGQETLGLMAARPGGRGAGARPQRGAARVRARGRLRALSTYTRGDDARFSCQRGTKNRPAPPPVPRPPASYRMSGGAGEQLGGGQAA
jgi:hypothetical protein